jgi:hypothetical protein
MVAYLTDRKRALEAGIKYLILASASAAFLLFGMALIYAATGAMEFSKLRVIFPRSGSETTLLPALRSPLPALASSWELCRSICGRRMFTRAHRRRWRHSSPLRPRAPW